MYRVCKKDRGTQKGSPSKVLREAFEVRPECRREVPRYPHDPCDDNYQRYEVDTSVEKAPPP